jgi:hypothetical protein
MRLASVVVVAAALMALACASNEAGYRWTVPPKGEFCFYEEMKKDQPFQMEYIVRRTPLLHHHSVSCFIIWCSNRVFHGLVNKKRNILVLVFDRRDGLHH